MKNQCLSLMVYISCYFTLVGIWNLCLPNCGMQCCRLQLKCDDTRWRKGGEMKRVEWVASTFYTTSEHGVSSITTADAHTSAASSRLNWPHRRFKWTRPFHRKTKSGFCACAITFKLASTTCLEREKKKEEKKKKKAASDVTVFILRYTL